MVPVELRVVAQRRTNGGSLFPIPWKGKEFDAGENQRRLLRCTLRHEQRSSTLLCSTPITESSGVIRQVLRISPDSSSAFKANKAIQIRNPEKKGAKMMKTSKTLKTQLKYCRPVRLTIFTLLLIVSSLTAASAQICVPNPAQDDPVTEWNCRAITRVLNASVFSPPAPPMQIRFMSIVHVSVHDAVNGLTGEYKTYLSPEPAPANASVDGAAIGAAYQALLRRFPAQAAVLEQEFFASLSARQIPTDDPGVAYGRNAANVIFNLRAADGAPPTPCSFQAPPNPGPIGIWVLALNDTVSPPVYPPAALPCFGNVVPWTLRNSSQFRVDAPPALDSEAYARDYNEVMMYGSVNSPVRSAEQTAIAGFWNGSPTDIWTQVLRQVSASRDLDLSARSRAFALVYMTATDASIAIWDSKYYYRAWRPTTSVARSLEDGNPDTNPAPFFWQRSLIPQWQHQHPEYPSGQVGSSAAMASALTLLFSNDPGLVLTPTIADCQVNGCVPVTREFGTFSQAIDEVSSARVWSGIHFRYASDAAARLGGQVARFTATHVLERCKGKGTCS